MSLLALLQETPSGSVAIPTSLVIGAVVALVGFIIGMAKIVQLANKAVLDERQTRLDFVAKKLEETEKREAAMADSLRMQLELATAQTRGAIPRRPGSLPGTGGQGR